MATGTTASFRNGRKINQLILSRLLRVPEPFLVSPPLLTAPDIVTAEGMVTVRVAPPRSTVPENVNAPLLTESPNVNVPPRTRLFVSVRPVAPSELSFPLFRVTVPVPSAEL
jgi:hypothetical protein